ncbi:PREDICTED: uncharacterized protein LOC104813642 [Tarenaya hassleriana]|uniref:uncharacterized protein LOC104813642 n=1 Tax=Tarenaya hassleriana TaxID=28532 RepID=UPI00053C5BB8|nr:PREDICTED: uncharacterized protein LOC104813642 [Tarenaya hassleriana]
MGKTNKENHKAKTSTPHPLLSCCKKVGKKRDSEKEDTKDSSQKEWTGSTCPICLERPHNAVLLLCSSYHKGCRPYMCATGSRFSNCLEQYKKTYSKEENTARPELCCPLCRGQVKGWTVVENARQYFNSKKRACMQESCSFVGSFRKLKKHMKEKHPHSCPRAVDPALEAKWKKLENERDRRDTISTIMSSTPGAIVFGDYVIEPYNDTAYGEDYNSDDAFSFLDLNPWQRQRPRLRFLDLETDDLATSSRSVPLPSPSLRHLLFARSQFSRRGNRS